MGLLLIFLLGSFAAMGRTKRVPNAVVTQDGKKHPSRSPLTLLRSLMSLGVEGSGGAYNIIQVEHGRIRVVGVCLTKLT